MKNQSTISKILKKFTGTITPEIKEILEDLNNYPRPSDKGMIAFEKIRQATVNYMTIILENCPACEDRYDALKLLREVRMRANSSIAMKGSF